MFKKKKAFKAIIFFINYALTFETCLLRYSGPGERQHLLHQTQRSLEETLEADKLAELPMFHMLRDTTTIFASTKAHFRNP